MYYIYIKPHLLKQRRTQWKHGMSDISCEKIRKQSGRSGPSRRNHLVWLVFGRHCTNCRGVFGASKISFQYSSDHKGDKLPALLTLWQKAGWTLALQQMQ